MLALLYCFCTVVNRSPSNHSRSALLVSDIIAVPGACCVMASLCKGSVHSYSCGLQSRGSGNHRLAFWSPKIRGRKPQCARREVNDSEKDPEKKVVPDTLPAIGADTDWREFRAKLVASSLSTNPDATPTREQWAHSVSLPEPGCLLLAHPSMFSTSQVYFFQAVILILAHGEKGSYGVILNKPTTYKMCDMGVSSSQLPELGPCRLNFGGDVGGGTVTILHSCPDLPGSVEVLKGLYTGAVGEVQAAIREGRCQPEQLHCYVNYAGWGPGQLQRECEAGVWLLAAANAPLVLSGSSYRGVEMWHRVLDCMGGENAQLSQAIRNATQGSHEQGSG